MDYGTYNVDHRKQLYIHENFSQNITMTKSSRLFFFTTLFLMSILTAETIEAKQKFASFKLKDIGHYKGFVRKGTPHGQGTLYLSDGGKYLGAWNNGKAHGIGTLFYNNGDRYQGNWKNGIREGKGKYFWSSGKHYVGEFKNGKPIKTGVNYSKKQKENIAWLSLGNSNIGTLRKSDGKTTRVKWVEK